MIETGAVGGGVEGGGGKPCYLFGSAVKRIYVVTFSLFFCSKWNGKSCKSIILLLSFITSGCLAHKIHRVLSFAKVHVLSHEFSRSAPLC